MHLPDRRPADRDQRIAFDLPFDLLQAIRLVHSVMETRFTVVVPKVHEQKFAPLKDVFNLTFELSDQPAEILPSVSISHPEPKSSIGHIERPLIFPVGIVKRCRSKCATIGL